MDILPKELTLIVLSYLDEIKDIEKVLFEFSVSLTNSDWITLFKLNNLEYYVYNLKNYNAKEIYLGFLLTLDLLKENLNYPGYRGPPSIPRMPVIPPPLIYGNIQTHIIGSKIDP